jgi:ribosomal-protein-alanine N-acetyltransferase
VNGSNHPAAGPTRPVLRRMRREDIPQVIEIDRLSFPMPWSGNVYQYELDHNPLSVMVVLAQPGEPVPSPSASGVGGWLRRLLGGRNGHGRPPQTILGYGGFWFSRQEAHVSTIAVRPNWRGRGLGEVLLAGMVRRALAMNAEVISLEVRVGNAPAIALYRKYEFARFGVKRGYYRDNNEDAFDLRVSPVEAVYYQRFAARWDALRQHLDFEDAFTDIAQPRPTF